MDKLDSLIEKPINALMWVACFIGFVMMIHITIDVTGRVLFNHPLIGTIEISSYYYMVAVSYLPLAYVTRNEGQIIVELFTRNLSRPRLLKLDIAVHIVTIAYLAVFTWQTAVMALEQTKAGEIWEMADTFLDIWPGRWLLPISFLMMMIYLIVRVAKDIRLAKQQ